MSSTEETPVKETPQRKTASQPQASAQAPVSSEALIYCGPSLPGGRLGRFAAYRGGLPKHLDKVLTDCPAIGRLFVPVSQLQSTLAAIGEPGTAQNVWFNDVLRYVQGGGKA